MIDKKLKKIQIRLKYHHKKNKEKKHLAMAQGKIWFCI